ncbi:MAG: BrnT family toxin [Polyangia bacterium]
MRFEWDPTKVRRNLAKHGVSFEEAATAFGDRLSITRFDPDHSEAEDRYLLLGATYGGRMIVVSHTHRGENVRIISARVASKRERRAYAGG